jgi:hypothetical protein
VRQVRTLGLAQSRELLGLFLFALILRRLRFALGLRELVRLGLAHFFVVLFLEFLGFFFVFLFVEGSSTYHRVCVRACVRFLVLRLYQPCGKRAQLLVAQPCGMRFGVNFLALFVRGRGFASLRRFVLVLFSCGLRVRLVIRQHPMRQAAAESPRPPAGRLDPDCRTRCGLREIRLPLFRVMLMISQRLHRCLRRTPAIFRQRLARQHNVIVVPLARS